MQGKAQSQEDIEQRYREHEQFIEQYLQNSENVARFMDMYNEGKRRFPLDLDTLRRADRMQLQEYHQTSSVKDFLSSPSRLLRVMSATLERMGEQYADQQGGGKKTRSLAEKKETYSVTVTGNFGRNSVTPRGLVATMVNNLVAVTGIVTKMGSVRQKLMSSVHHVPTTGQDTIRQYHDNNDPQEDTQLKTSTVVPLKDEQGNAMYFEYGLSRFKNIQTLLIQELPEKTPTGQLPRSVEVILEDDLVDLAKPGDRITVVGVYKCFAKMSTQFDGSFRSMLLALGVQKMDSEEKDKEISASDEELIHKIVTRKDLLQYVSRSIAPSIYGHEDIKQATLLLLIGGSEKNLVTGTHLRGDINMLLVGDPSTAKSQMLRYILTIAPLAITTTGRGSSSVGLTAAVRRDQESGENVLEAGAMVLADGGVVLIDEFDKMNEVDRVAIHEVMEQQTVTIAKAGIHCSLNARCSVVAAANPIYGQYDQNVLPTKNIGLPDSLLSRFDLLFIVRDEKLEHIDRKVAERVTKNHRFRGQEESQIGNLINLFKDQQIQVKVKTETGPYVSALSNLYQREHKDTLNQSFLRKFISYVKKNVVTTTLDEESVDYIVKQWVELRAKSIEERSVKTMPITIRTYEAIIRLASAHAKLRLSKQVTIEDCQVAVRLLKASLLWSDEVDQLEEIEEELEEPIASKPKRSTKKEKVVNASDAMEEEVVAQQEPPKRQTRTKQASTPEKEERQVTQSLKRMRIDDDLPSLNKTSLASVQVPEKMRNQIYKAIYDLREEKRKVSSDVDMININESWDYIDKKAKVKPTREQFHKALFDLEDANKVYIDAVRNEVQLL